MFSSRLMKSIYRLGSLNSHERLILPQIPKPCAISKSFGTDPKMVTVKVVPALEDNYMYIVIDEETGDCAAVDPVEPQKILTEINSCGANLTSVLTTHHHWDHAGGNKELHALAPGATFYGGDEQIMPASLHRVHHNDIVQIGKLKIKCLFTPCHTAGHVCYYVDDDAGGVPAVFTGDTLFAAGCGKFFEGTKEQMHAALIGVLSTLPGNTLVYCGHEYTVNNLKFALHVEPSNSAAVNKLAWATERRRSGLPTIPTTVDEEKLINPFMRVNIPSVKQFAGLDDPIEVMGFLRSEKDKFRPK